MVCLESPLWDFGYLAYSVFIDFGEEDPGNSDTTCPNSDKQSPYCDARARDILISEDEG